LTNNGSQTKIRLPYVQNRLHIYQQTNVCRHLLMNMSAQHNECAICQTLLTIARDSVDFVRIRSIVLASDCSCPHINDCNIACSVFVILLYLLFAFDCFQIVVYSK